MRRWTAWRVAKIAIGTVAGVAVLGLVAVAGFAVWFLDISKNHPMLPVAQSYDTRIFETVIAGHRFCIPENHFFGRPDPVMDAAILAFWFPDYSGFRTGRIPGESAKNHFSALVQEHPPRFTYDPPDERELEETITGDGYIIDIVNGLTVKNDENRAFIHSYFDAEGHMYFQYNCDPYTKTPNQRCTYRRKSVHLFITGHFDYDYEHVVHEMIGKIDHLLWNDLQCPPNSTDSNSLGRGTR